MHAYSHAHYFVFINVVYVGEQVHNTLWCVFIGIWNKTEKPKQLLQLPRMNTS